jgi:uncharacterized protein DUF87
MTRLPETGTASLVLGWRMTPADEPRYWLRPVGSRSDPDAELVCVDAKTMATHTIVLAQSGSGKSFFLGRLVEELLLRTKARCLILDPNADFRRAGEVESETLWTEAGYNRASGEGKLPHERTRDEFVAGWRNITKSILMGPHLPTSASPTVPLTLPWTRIAVDVIVEGLEPSVQAQFYHCHQITKLVAGRLSAPEAERTIDIAEDICELPSSSDAGAITQRLGPPAHPSDSTALDISAALKYIEKAAVRHYFSTARRYIASGVFSQSLAAARARDDRLSVVDLPSIPSLPTRLLAVDALLEAEWIRARQAWADALVHPISEDKRVPTFIVVDEAHNMIPFTTQSHVERIVRDRFRTIVAEGRKYGIFLIAVSQRPEKLDELVMSECDNKALMRIGSKSTLDRIRKGLGLDDIPERVLDRCLGLGKGRVLMSGSWAPHGTVMFYSAARRTVEGGRNLLPSHWAVP